MGEDIESSEIDEVNFQLNENIEKITEPQQFGDIIQAGDNATKLEQEPFVDSDNAMCGYDISCNILSEKCEEPQSKVLLGDNCDPRGNHNNLSNLGEKKEKCSSQILPESYHELIVTALVRFIDLLC